MDGNPSQALPIDDISPADRAWAEAIAGLTGIRKEEAYKRVRRIRYDTKIQAMLHEIAGQLGSHTVITNIEWSGPTMEDLTVSVAPAPVGVDESVIAKARASTGAKHSIVKETKLRLAKLSADQVEFKEAQQRAAMRLEVARFELERLYGKPKTALPLLALWGFLS